MPSKNSEQRKLAAIMFTDMVGYSALTQRNESLALELLEEHRRLLRDLFPKFNGREVETTGDGFLVEFASALEAARCAIEIQRAVSTRNLTVSHDRQIQLRIGIHVGDVIHKDGHVLGDGVNIAARLQPLAEPGGICISVDVARQVQNNLQATVVKMGEAELKNIRLPIEICRIVLPWEKNAPPVAPSPLQRSKKKGFPVVLALVLVALGGIGISFYYFSGRLAKLERTPQTNTAPSVARAVEAKSVAVLPFVNMSADKGDEYLSDGMTEELLNVLAKVPGLRVPGRGSSFAFKGKTEDNIFRKVGEQLHVSTVLEGSVRKAGDKLRITAQLINVADGFHLWSETYDGDMKDILSVQSDVAQRVVQALQVKLGVEATRALAKAPTEKPEAHRLYLLGRHYSSKTTAEDSKKAVEYFNQALQKDPNYARAYCGLVDTMGDFRWVPKESYPKLRAYAEEALKLDPLLAEAHVSIAQMLLFADWDFPGAKRELQLALKLNPNLASAYDVYALYSYLVGQFPEAVSAAKKALVLDPLSSELNNALAWAYYNTHDFNNAIKSAKQAMEMDLSYPWNYGAIGLSLTAQGKPSEAIPQLEKLVSLVSVPLTRSQLACAYAAARERPKAEALLKELDDLSTRQFVPPSSRGFIRLALGQKERALELFEHAVDERDPSCLWMKCSPGYDGLRTEPRFQALLEKVGLDK